MTAMRGPNPILTLMPPSRWTLVWQSYVSLAAAMVLGTMASVPFLCSRVRFFDETTYLVGASPQDDARLREWALSRPGVVSFKTARRGKELWVRWEVQSFYRPPPSEEIVKQMLELGYEFQGMRGGANGLASGLRDLLTDARTLAMMLLGMQVAFAFIGLNRIRTAVRKQLPMPPLFSGHHGRAVTAGLVAGLVLLCLGLLNSFALKALQGHSPPSPWDCAQAMPAATRLAFLVFGGLGAPIAEEIFFRGYVFGMFKGAGHLWFGVLVSAGLFGVVHFSDPYNVPCICLYGVLLAWLYHRTESLLAPITAHTVNNAVVIGCMLLA